MNVIIKRSILTVYEGPLRIIRWIEASRKAGRCNLGRGAVLYPSSRIKNHRARSAITIGENSRLLCELHTMGHGGHISIGHSCFVGENTKIWSAQSVTIGNRVLVSHDVNIHDTDSHSLSAALRHEHFKEIFSNGHPKTLEDVKSEAITIGDDAWIGFGATILKGVTIGEGAVVAARSVVTKSVEPFTIVAGSPARQVGRSRE